MADNIPLYSLVVVDSQIIEKQLRLILTDESLFPGKTWKVISCFGKFMDFRGYTNLSLTENYEPVFTVANRKFQNILDSFAKQSKEIFLACYPDVSGNAQAIHIADYLLKSGISVPIERIELLDISKDTFVSQLKQKSEFKEAPYKAYKASRAINRVIDFSVNPVLGQVIIDGATAGLNKSAALYHVIKQTIDRQQFPYRVVGVMEDGTTFESSGFNSVKDANAAAIDVEKNLSVSMEDTKEVLPPLVFNTYSLCSEAASLLKSTSDETLKLAFDLYFAGLITYPLTVGTRLGEKQIYDTYKYIEAISDSSFVGSSRHVDSIPGIYPVDIFNKPSTVETSLSVHHAKIYNLIWLRTISSCAVKARVQEYSLVYDDLITSQSFSVQENGWFKFHPNKTEIFARKGTDKVKYVTVKKVDSFSEVELLQYLEDLGLEPSSINYVIRSLTYHNYLTRLEDKSFVPTNKGRLLVRFLLKNYKFLLSSDYCKKIQRCLDAIQQDKLNDYKFLAKAISSFYKVHAEVEILKPGTSDCCKACSKKYRIVSTDTVVFAQCRNKECDAYGDAFDIDFDETFKIHVKESKL